MNTEVQDPWFVVSGHNDNQHHELFRMDENGETSQKIALFFDRKPAKSISKVLNSHQALVEALETISHGACLQQMLGDKCICYSCIAKAALAKGGDL